ncbi:MAG: ATP synthase F1 subunit delta [Clostridiales bacterium]|jgi:F-type H+-transporting ATPase subunit delta|nr:ATP synthase F1 subunit delta [Clostridiales bacterium]
MTPLAPRYAEALFWASPSDARQIYDIISSFANEMNSNAELKDFLFNPSIRKSVKTEAIGQICETTPETARKFLSLLMDKGRLAILPDIAESYAKIIAENEGALRIAVYSAEPLDEAQLETIKNKYIEKLGATNAVVENKTDPSLMGGVCVQIGDERVDDTIRAKLASLREAMLDAN